MKVIGTAGHVDHGKSTLVEALTGTHPDRLKEEREREMTIDLGFAWMVLPNGEEVGIVDVPGHRDFIENMLAGVGGIDAVLFVIAADEGVMPQTREHLAILDLLQIQGGVVALTKIDMIEDPDWLALVEEDVRQALSGSVLAQSPIVRVSAKKKVGLVQLCEALATTMADQPPRQDLGKPRLPVDRVFTIAGFGTVVTGTLTDGSLRVGDEVEVLPKGLKGRIRGLQTHKRKEELAVPGSRTAVNISGLTVEQIERGNIIAHPRDYRTTYRLDVHFRLLQDASQAIHHNSQVKFFIGAAEVLSRLRLLGVEELRPGEEGWLQIELAEPVVAVRGDRYILRRPSPGETLGGGTVVDPFPTRRHKRFSRELIDRLVALAAGSPADVLLQALIAAGTAPFRDVIARTQLSEASSTQAVEELYASGQMIYPEGGQHQPSPAWDGLVASRGYWDQLTSRAILELEGFHRANPLRRGMPKEELKSRLKTSPRVFAAVIGDLASHHRLQEAGPLVVLPGFEIRFNAEQERAVQNLMQRFAASEYSPPSVKECQSEAGEVVYAALIETGRLLQVSSDVVFSRDGYDQMLREVLHLLDEHGTITAAQVRDYFNTSRKYVLAFLEHLDGIGMTVRDGDVRRRRT